MNMRPKVWIGMVLVAVCAIQACLGGSSIRRNYYALEYPRGTEVKRYDTPPYDALVRVRRFETAIAYDRQEIAYRANPYEISYYWYRLWTAKPRKMMEQLVLTHLRDTNMFRDVVRRSAGSLPDFDLWCEIGAIEELDSTEEQWWARLALRCHLTDFKTGKQVMDFAFDERKRVFQRLPQFVVRSLSELLEVQMTHFTDALDAFFAKRAGLPAPKAHATAHPSTDKSANAQAGQNGQDGQDSDAPDGSDTKTPSAHLKR